MKHLKFTHILFVTLIIFGGCRKFVELPKPDDRLTSSTVYTTNEVATSVINGLYIRLSETQNVLSYKATTYLGFAADELTNYDTDAESEIYQLYQNNVKSNTELYWSSTYTVLYHCNVAIEGLTASNTLNPKLKLELIGEAKFMRGLLYYYMVNTYGKVPLILTSDYKANLGAKRAEVSNIYAQIISDLKDAQLELSRDYLQGDATTAYPTGSEERIRPTYWAATALLARIYLYTKQWSEAETNAEILINNNELFSLVAPGSVFLKNSNESIFQLEPVIPYDFALFDARTFVLTSSIGNFNNPASISPQLEQAFEAHDQRMTNWTGRATIAGKSYLFPYKYKANTAALAAGKPEYLTILRLGEQYLIRSEARAQLNNLAGSVDDLNKIRTRAGLGNTTATTQAALLDAIVRERRIELFCEQGHRWFDLKRTGLIDVVMKVVTPQKGGTWEPYKQLMPIPSSDIANSPGLDQNPGYN